MRLRSLLLLSLLAGCGGPPQSAARPVPSTPPGAASPPAAPVAWNDFTPALFARAKAEGRFVVLDGAAEWCHFCHVMDEKTYGDARVRAVLQKHFLASKVDVDTRPDIEERYTDWGWPATVIFSPDGHELGKYRGFIPPEEFLEILARVVSGGARAEAREDAVVSIPKAPLSDDALALARSFTETELEEFWDNKEGGWGREPKVPLGWNTLFALSAARRGDARAKEHALTILDKQTKLIDPVWGGIYQYSVAPDWDHPHFEKLMFWNAGALAAYAEAFALTNDPKQRARAADIRRYFEGFLLSEGGAFYGTQDADLNSHASSVPFAPTSPRGKGEFMKGEDYYKLPDAARRVLGVPRIDPNIYADDNGLAIYALATLARATNDSSASALAKRAADHILREHITAEGGVLHLAKAKDGDQSDAAVRVHLSDAAALGFGLAHLADVLTDGALKREAGRIATFLEKNLYDEVGGGFFAQPVDPNAVGIFRSRRKPFDDNVLAARFLLRLDMLEGAAKRRGTIEHTVRSLSSAAAIKDRGKFLGDYLLLLDELTSHRRLPASVPSPAATEPSGHPPAPKAPPKAAPKRPAPARDPAHL